MVVSVSGVLLLAVIVLLLCRKGGLKTWHAVTCALLGFYLASTSIAPGIRQSTASVAALISSIRM
ncbi:membrane protein [Catenulispora yoronensis]|uniref:Membrane protein n=1 Tax=Catenulispora yoronensis TaxID=450799 RepID=A0ABN2V0Z5_9ACTN